LVMIAFSFCFLFAFYFSVLYFSRHVFQMSNLLFEISRFRKTSVSMLYC